MNKKVILISLVIILLVSFWGCDSTNSLKPIRVRLADDYNSYWVPEAIGTINNENVNYVPKIAFIDTGCFFDSNQIAYKYNLVSDNKDIKSNSDHGTMLIKEFVNVNKYASLYIFKISESDTEIDEKLFTKAIYLAIEQKVDIINISLGTSKDYPSVKKAIADAIDEGIVIVASAGNGGGEKLLYPAAYDGVISVLARDINNLDIITNSKDKLKRSFSAPGEHIYVDGEYITGTSIATIYITNAVSYIKSQKQEVDLMGIIQYLEKSSEYPTEYTYGMISYDKLQEQLKF